MGKEKRANVPHILIVEDQPNTADMLTSYFETQGYLATAKAWGEDALEFVDKTVPDLVVLDIHLPDMTGYDICRRLRSQRHTAQVPIIFLTEKRERDDRLKGLELGAVDYITKPFDIQELRLRVQNVLRRSNVERATHSVTGLPGPRISDERLRELHQNGKKWAVLSVGLRGLDAFSEEYGFLARDDVLRAVALMLNHVVGESRNPDSFVGHIDDYDLFVIINSDEVEEAKRALSIRLNEAMAFFYPRNDWDSEEKHPKNDLPQVEIVLGVLDIADKAYSDLDALKEAIIEAQAAS